MRALVRSHDGVAVAERTAPVVVRADDVAIRVETAGICRTDLHVASGRLFVDEPRILGHEAAGIVVDAGADARALVGERVAIIPITPCRACASCLRGGACGRPAMLGVDRDGASCDRVVVSAAEVIRVPASMSMRLAAFVEPVAAALAVVDAPIARASRGLVVGDGRIAALTSRVLAAHGFASIERATAATAAQLASDAFDFVIETDATTALLAAAIDALRPRGTLVLKSRPARSPEIAVRALVLKELTVVGRAYGSFAAAVELLATRRLVVDDLLGEAFFLADFARAFETASADEAQKTFLTLTDAEG